MDRRFDPAHKERLLSAERRLALDTDRVLSLLPLRPYDVVADIGCGPGFFAVPLGKYLRDGKLYAVDVQEEMVAECRRRVEEVRLANVEVGLCGPTSFPIDAGTLDGVLLAFVVHEADDRNAFLKAVSSLLRPGAWCAVLEWYRKAMDEGPPLEHRVSREQVRRLAEDIGLEERWVRDLNGKHYAMLFVRRKEG